MATTVTSKGQVTIPKSVRDLLRVRAGSRVEFHLGHDGQVVVRNADAAPQVEPADRFSRVVGRATSGMSTDQIMALTRGEDRKE